MERVVAGHTARGRSLRGCNKALRQVEAIATCTVEFAANSYKLWAAGACAVQVAGTAVRAGGDGAGVVQPLFIFAGEVARLREEECTGRGNATWLHQGLETGRDESA